MRLIDLKKGILVCFAVILNIQLLAQDIQDNTVMKTQMEKLAFMEGSWKGTGWHMGMDRQKRYFEQREEIILTLDGTAILIQGMGIQKMDTIHHALGIINYDQKKQVYNFRTYLKDGKFGDYKLEIIDGQVHWYPIENVRYIISINDKNEWVEIGEVNKYDQWYQFFEMTLAEL